MTLCIKDETLLVTEVYRNGEPIRIGHPSVKTGPEFRKGNLDARNPYRSIFVFNPEAEEETAREVCITEFMFQQLDFKLYDVTVTCY